jgi:menaquinone-dependent protoporphyrinogen oxidase
MKTLIAYSSKYGCTEKCAVALAERLSGETCILNLKKDKSPDLSGYDTVVVGGPVYIGKINKEVKNFCIKNLDWLKGKRLGLFICCMAEEDKAMEELYDAFPKELLEAAVAKEYFGGEFLVTKMNSIDRMIVKKVAKTDRDVSKILADRIDSFAKLMNKA